MELLRLRRGTPLFALVAICLLAALHQVVTTATTRAADDARIIDLLDADRGGAHGYVEVATMDDGGMAVTIHLAAARAPSRPYGVSVCHAGSDGAVACVPTGTPLGVRLCQTQSPNTGIVYCGWVDGDGNWYSTGVLQRFAFAGLSFDANMVLIWNLNDGTDYYRADLAPDLPDDLQLSPWLPPSVPDDD